MDEYLEKENKIRVSQIVFNQWLRSKTSGKKNDYNGAAEIYL